MNERMDLRTVRRRAAAAAAAHPGAAGGGNVPGGAAAALAIGLATSKASRDGAGKSPLLR